MPAALATLIRRVRARAGQWVLPLLMGGATAGVAWATPIWHCSRQPPELNASPDGLHMAVMGTVSDAIPLSMADLLSAYAGQAVSIGGMTLTACMLAPQQALAAQVIHSLGLNIQQMQQRWSQPSAAPSWIRQVHNDQAMIDCINEHYPAVGFLSQPVQHDRVMPCF